MSKYYKARTDRLNRSFQNEYMDIRDPYKALAAAIIFQAAVDCDNYDPEIEKPYSLKVIKYGQKCRFEKLREFINSDWIDMLLCWQQEITPISVCENLVARLERNLPK